MKKKLFNLFAICLCAIAFLASCGGPKDATKELEISNAEVLGDSADVVSIVDGTYTLVGVVPTDITQTLSIKIKLRLERPIQDKDLHISGWNLEILDKNGTSLLDKLILRIVKTVNFSNLLQREKKVKRKSLPSNTALQMVIYIKKS